MILVTYFTLKQLIFFKHRYKSKYGKRVRALKSGERGDQAN